MLISFDNTNTLLTCKIVEAAALFDNTYDTFLIRAPCPSARSLVELPSSCSQTLATVHDDLPVSLCRKPVAIVRLGHAYATQLRLTNPPPFHVNTMIR